MAKKRTGLGKGLGTIFLENESENGNSTITINISELEPNREQPRKDFDEEALAQLAESVKRHGLIQPILVRPMLGGGYQIVAGERRYRACQLAGVTEVPVSIRDLTDKETMEIALIENLQRENLNPIEEAQGYKALMDEHGLTQEEVSEAVGKSRPAVANSLRLLKLPEEVSVMVGEGKISSGHARALLSFEDENEMLRVAKEIALSDMSVRQIEKLAKTKKDKKPKPAPVKSPTYYSIVEQTLTEYLGKKVKITPLKNKKGGTLSIEFYSNDDLQTLAKKLEDK